jgi:hypothetical protein
MTSILKRQKQQQTSILPEKESRSPCVHFQNSQDFFINFQKSLKTKTRFRQKRNLKSVYVSMFCT